MCGEYGEEGLFAGVPCLIGKDGVIVTDGLRPGEQVVSAGATRLVDGQQVKVLTD